MSESTEIRLLKLCKQYGVDSKGVKQIAKETVYTKRSIYSKIDEYCLIPNLQAGLLDE
jgi:hypothetical protein